MLVSHNYILNPHLRVVCILSCEEPQRGSQRHSQLEHCVRSAAITQELLGPTSCPTAHPVRTAQLSNICNTVRVVKV